MGAAHNRFGLPLSYPNLSLGQIASGHDSGRQSSDQPLTEKEEELLVEKHYTTGATQAVLVTFLLIGLLFASLDTSIASTSLLTISQDLDDFVNAPWIVLAYLLTYMGFAVFISKLSDIYGRRNMLVLSWVVFTAFSLGCASSTDMIALIVCRAFQGVGASGLYSLTQIGLVEVGPSHRPSLIGAMIGVTLAVAFVLGPIIGGAVSQLSDWRWLFNMNIPFGLVAILVVTNFWPRENAANVFSWEAFIRIDFIGGFTLLSSSSILVFAVQQAGSQVLSWNSPTIISALSISGICWIGFIWWEIVLELQRRRSVEPIFPIRLLLRRVYSAGLLLTLLTGFPYIALSIIIPERLQIVEGENVLMAGVHILPLLGGCALGSFLAGAISSQQNNTSYTLIVGSCLQLLGVGLMIIAPEVKRELQYLFQAIFGLGVGLCLSAATIMTNLVAPQQHERASAQGAVAQARVLGGCLGLSICTVVFNLHVNEFLEEHLSEQQLEQIHRSPLAGLQLPVDVRQAVRTVYAGAFTEEIRLMVVVCAIMAVVSLFTLEKHPLPIERLKSMPKAPSTCHRDSDCGTELHEITPIERSI